MRSTLRAVVFCIAAFAIPVGGAFTLREGLVWMPEALWAAALPAAVVAGMRWNVAGVLGLTIVGGLLIAGVNIPAASMFRVTPLTVEVGWLLGGWALGSLGAGFVGAWLAARWRSGARLQELTDPLTGLPNRRRAELYLEHEFAVAQLGRPLSMLLIDVDGFTAYGTAQGDVAAQGLLRTIGSILRANTRTVNLSAHWTGDRFACLMNGTGQEGAFAYARLIQDCIRAAGDVAAVPPVSIGIATYSREMNSPDALVRAAEQALAQAKRDGGNRIRLLDRAFEDDGAASGETGLRLAERPGRTAAEARPGSGSPAGPGRTAFVFSGDSTTRYRVVELLERRGFHVTEASRASETMRPLGREFDLVVVDLTHDDPGVRDLVREVRRRHPATRVAGIPLFDGETIRTPASAVHVDAHLLPASGRWLFQPALSELLHERDRLRGAAMRALQLSDEVHAKEREARTARQEGEARLRSVVQSINEVLFRVDRSGAWIALSPAWTGITGHAVETSLGRPWIDFFHEDDRVALRDEFNGLSAIERPIVRRQARILTRAGGVRWVEMRAELTHDRFGNVQSAAGTLRDITERRRAEEALRRNEEYFRALIENAADVIIVVDADHRIRYASPSVVRVLGSEIGDGTAFPDLEHICHPDDVPALHAALKSAESPGATANVEMRATGTSGSWRHLTVAIRNLSHIQAVRGLVLNAHDVTAHRKAERALHESEEALFRARKMDAIGLLAGGVASDFDNLLTAIRDQATTAARALDADHAGQAALSQIRDSAGRASALTRQLLAFGRRQVLRPRDVGLNAFIGNLSETLGRIVGSQIRLLVDASASPDRVHVDPLQIERVVLNLAVNAREAMSDGGTLTIRTARQTIDADEAAAAGLAPGSYVILSMSDTGHGISEEIQPHVFDPFFTTKSHAVGTGLGLSTVYGIVRQTGGLIRLESRSADAGQPSGTTFSICLPEAGRAAVETGGDEPAAAATGTIVVVDDEDVIRKLAGRILRRSGYEVIEAESGKQAIELLARHPGRVDLLLTDVVMPGLDGRELADRVAMMRPGIGILFMSGYTREEVESHGIRITRATLIEKPFSVEDLVSRVRHALGATDVGDPAPGDDGMPDSPAHAGTVTAGS